jgi:fatty acid desaturase
MEDNAKSIGSLLEKATDYGKTSFEVVKLKTLEKTSEVASSLIPHSFVLVLIASFLVFLNLGIAFWLGEILGKIYFGFFIVTAFYGVSGIVVHFFMHKWLKRIIRDYIIKLVLK